MSNNRSKHQQVKQGVSIGTIIILLIVALGGTSIFRLPESRRYVEAVKLYDETMESLEGEPYQVINAKIKEIAEKNEVFGWYAGKDNNRIDEAEKESRVSVETWWYMLGVASLGIFTICMAIGIILVIIFYCRQLKKNHSVQKGWEKAKFFIGCSILLMKVICRDFKEATKETDFEKRVRVYRG